MEAIANYFSPFTQSKYNPNAYSSTKRAAMPKPALKSQLRQSYQQQNKKNVRFADSVQMPMQQQQMQQQVPQQQQQMQQQMPQQQQQVPQQQQMQQQQARPEKAIICMNDADYSKGATLGNWAIPGAEDRFARQFIDTINGTPGASPNDIHIIPSILAPTTSTPGRANGQVGSYASRMSPQYNHYHPENDNLFAKSKFEEPIFDSEQRLSTGVMINTYTGQMYEMFENDVPPPDLDVSRDHTEEQLTHTNPFLIWKQGNRDPNRDEPNKTEVLAYQPNADGGCNVWGDQLYADRIRSELQIRAARDVWQNRNGDVPIEAVIDRHPNGYLGFVPAARYFPYVPATKRQFIDNKSYTPAAGPAAVQSTDSASAMAPRIRLKEPVGGNGNNTINSYVGNPSATQAGSLTEISTAYGAAFDARDPTRLNEEIYFPGPVDGNKNNSPYVVIDIIPRETLKPEIAEQSFNLNLPIQTSESIGTYVVLDTTTKETLKSMMQQEFATLPVSYVADLGSYIVIDHEVRETLKPQIMEATFEVAPVQYDAQVGAYVLIDREARDTLKPIVAENNFLSWVNADGATQTAPYVILDLNPRDTLKVITGETAFSILNANSEKDGTYVVIDTTVRDTLKTQLETMFATTAANSETTGAYTVQDLKVRDTLKGVLQTMFATTNANAEGAGNWLSFRGNLRETSRMFYENEGFRPCIDGSNETGGIAFEGIASTKADANFRGIHDPQYFYALSRVLSETEDNSIRQIGHDERVTNRERCATLINPVKPSLQDNLVIPTLQTSKPDAREINDFNATSQGFGGEYMSVQLPYLFNRTMLTEQMENN